MTQGATNVKGPARLTGSEAPRYFFGVNGFELPVLAGARGLTCRLFGRGDRPRPDPVELVRLLGLPDGSVVATARQVHSSRCLVVDAQDASTSPGGRFDAGEGDALLTIRTGLALGVATADCLPIAAVDLEARALAVVHAGWRGTVDGVLAAALTRMIADLGARPERILVGAGAGAGACCYRVGGEVVERFSRQRPTHAAAVFSKRAGGSVHLDLVEANRLQALDAGVARERFGALPMCTICRPDLFPSYRRDGASAGRMWLLAALTEEVS